MATQGSNELNALLKAKVVKILVELDYKNSNLSKQVNDISKYLKDQNKQVKVGVKLDLTIKDLNAQLKNLYETIDKSKTANTSLKVKVDLDVTGSASAIKKQLKEVYDTVQKFNNDYGKQLKQIQKLNESSSRNSTTPFGSVDPASYIQSLKEAESYMRKMKGNSGLFSTTELKDADGKLQGFIATLTKANGIVEQIRYQWNEEAQSFAPINQKTVTETQKSVDKAKRILQSMYADISKLRDSAGKNNLLSDFSNLENKSNLTSNDVADLQRRVKEEQVLESQIRQENTLYQQQQKLLSEINAERSKVANRSINNQMGALESQLGGLNLNDVLASNNISELKTQFKDLQSQYAEQVKLENDLRSAEEKRAEVLNQLTEMQKKLNLNNGGSGFASNQFLAETRTMAESIKSMEDYIEVRRRMNLIDQDSQGLKTDEQIKQALRQLEVAMKNYSLATGLSLHTIDEQFAGTKESIKNNLALINQEIAKFQQKTQIANTNARLDASSNSVVTNMDAGKIQGLIDARDTEALKQYIASVHDADVAMLKLNTDARGMTRITAQFESSTQTARELVLELSAVDGRLREVASRDVFNANRNLGVLEQLRVAMARVPVWMVAMTAFYGTINLVKQMSQQLIQVSQELNDIQRVASGSISLDTLFGNAVQLSQQLGANLNDVLSTMGDMAKTFGDFNERQLTAITQTAILMSNVSDLSVQQAGQDLVATMNAFNLSAEQTMHVVDALNQVDNDYAISTTQLADGLMKSASTAKVYGVTLEQLVGNITAIGAVTMETGDVIGNSLKSIYSRLTTVASARDALQSVGVALKDQAGNARSAESILGDLAVRWNRLTDGQRQNIAVQVAGRYQLSRFIALMNNWQMSVDATNTAVNSQGSALRENAIYMQSYQARINQLKSSFTEFSTAVGKEILSAGIMTAISALEGLLNVGVKIASTFGTLPTILIPIVALLGKFGTLGKISGFFGGITTEIRAFSGASAGAETMLSKLWSNYRVGTAMGVGQIKSMTNAWRSLTVAEMGATDESKAWALSMKAGLIETGVGVAIVALGYAVEKIANAVEKARQKQQELTSTNDKMVKSYRQSSDGMQSMVKRYEELDSIQLRTKDQQAEYVQLQKDFANQLPTTVAYVDAQGNAHMKSAQAIAQEVQNVKELSQAQSKLKVVEFNQNIQKQADSYKKVNDQIKKLNDERANLEANNGKATIVTNGAGDYVTYSTEIQHLDGQIEENKIKTMMAEAQKTEVIKSTIKVLQSQALAYLDANNELTNLTDQQQSVVEDFIAENEQILRSANDSTKAQQGLYTIATQVGDVFSQAYTTYQKTLGSADPQKDMKLKDFQTQLDNMSKSLPQYFFAMTDANGNVIKSQDDIVNGLKQIINVSSEVGSASPRDIGNLVYQLERAGLNADDAQATLFRFANANDNTAIKAQLASQGIDGETASMQDLNQATLDAIDVTKELFGYSNSELEGLKTRLTVMQALVDANGKNAESTQKYQTLAKDVAQTLGITTDELEQNKNKVFAVAQAMEAVDWTKFTPNMNLDKFIDDQLGKKFTDKTKELLKNALTHDAFTGAKTDFENQLEDTMIPPSKKVAKQMTDIFKNLKLKLPPVDMTQVVGSTYYVKNNFKDLMDMISRFGIQIGKPTKDSAINQIMSDLDRSKGKVTNTQDNLVRLRGIITEAINNPKLFTYTDKAVDKTKDKIEKAKKASDDFNASIKKEPKPNPSKVVQSMGQIGQVAKDTGDKVDKTSKKTSDFLSLLKNPYDPSNAKKINDAIGNIGTTAEKNTTKVQSAQSKQDKAVETSTSKVKVLISTINTANKDLETAGTKFKSDHLVSEINKAGKAVDSLKSKLGSMSKSLNSIGGGKGVQKLVSELGLLSGNFVLATKYGKNMEDAITKIVSTFSKSYKDNEKGIKGMLDTTTSSLETMTLDYTKFSSKSTDGIKSMTSEMQKAFKSGMKDIVNQANDLPSQIGKAIKDNMKDSTDGIDALAKDMVKKFKEDLGIHSPSKVFTELGGWVVKGLVNGLNGEDMQQLGQSVFKDFGGGVMDSLDSIKAYLGGNMGGVASPKAVTGWLEQAIGKTGVDQSWLPALQTIAMKESGGNPSAVNNWDSNAKAGHPSTGLMQVIQPTFDAYAMKGHNDIFNPVDNAIASIEYIKKRYGSVFNVPGIRSMAGGGGYKGYATGGIVDTPELAWHGEDGEEAIIPLTQKYRTQGLALWEQASEKLGIPQDTIDFLKKILTKQSGTATGGNGSAGASSGDGGTASGDGGGTSGTIVPSTSTIVGGWNLYGGYDFTALDSYSDYVNTDYSSSSSSTKKKKTSSKSSSSTQSLAEAFSYDKYQRELDALDAYITVLNTRIGEMAKGVTAYRNALEEIIKQENTHLKIQKQDLSAVEARQTAIKKELALLPSVNRQNAKQRDEYNKLMQEYDSNLGKINSLKEGIESDIATIKQQSLEVFQDFISQIATNYQNAIGKIKEQVSKTDFTISVYQAQNPNDQKGLMNLQEQKATELQGQQATAYNEMEDMQKRYDDAVKQWGASSQHALAVKQQLDQATQDYQDATTAVIQAETDLKNTRASIADDSIQKLKDYYTQEKAMADSAIDNEKQKLQDAHDAKMQMYQDEQDSINAIYDAKQKQLDQANAEEDYAKQMNDYNKQKADLQNKIALLSRDTSQEGKKNLADAQAQLDTLNGQISDAQTQHQRDQEKQALSDQQQGQINSITGYTDANGVKHDGLMGTENKSFQAQSDQLDAQKKATDAYYDNLINDDKKWTDLRNQAIAGNFDNINKELDDMAKNLSDQLNGVFSGLYTAGAKIGSDTASQLKTDNQTTLSNMQYDSQQTISNSKSASQANDYTMTNGTVQKDKATTVHDPSMTTSDSSKSSSSKSSSSKKKSSSSEKKSSHKSKDDPSNNYKTKSALNFRSKPEYGNDIITVIPKGTKVDYYGMDKGWAKIKYKGKTGYVGKDYLIKMDTGGYTGDDVPDNGALAVLHKKELVLNKEQTQDILDTAKLMDKMKGFIPKVAQSTIANKLATAMGNTITNHVSYGDINVTVQGADKKKASDVAKEIMSEIKKKGK